MVRGFSSPTGCRPEPKPTFKTPRDDHDQSILSCQNTVRTTPTCCGCVASRSVYHSRLAEAGRGRGWRRPPFAGPAPDPTARGGACWKDGEPSCVESKPMHARACFAFDAGSLAEDGDGERRAAAVTMGDSGLHRAAQKGDCVPRLCA